MRPQPTAPRYAARSSATLFWHRRLSEADTTFSRSGSPAASCSAERFERLFIGQGQEDRSIAETLDIGWLVLSALPVEELERIRKGIVHKYYRRVEEEIHERGERRESVLPEA